MRRFADDSKRKRGAPQGPEPHKMIRKKSPMVTARNERGTETRKSSYFKQAMTTRGNFTTEMWEQKLVIGHAAGSIAK